MNNVKYTASVLLAFAVALPFHLIECIFVEPVRLWRRLRAEADALRVRDELAAKKIAIAIARSSASNSELVN